MEHTEISDAFNIQLPNVFYVGMVSERELSESECFKFHWVGIFFDNGKSILESLDSALSAKNLEPW